MAKGARGAFPKDAPPAIDIGVRSSSRRLLLFAALTLTVLPRAAAAQPSTAERAIAERLFEQGKEQLHANSVSAACESFAESQRLDPSTGTLLNLAACHQQEGKLASAWVEFRECASAARPETRPDRLRFALDHLAEIEPRLPFLTLMVPAVSGGPAPVVRLDGRDLGPAAWRVPIPADEGWHEAFAQVAPGGRPWRATFLIHNGEKLVLSIPPPALASAALASPALASPTHASPTDASPTHASPTLASPTHASPTDASPTHASPAHASPTDASPTHTSPTHASPAASTAHLTPKPPEKQPSLLLQSGARPVAAIVAGGLGLAAIGVGAYAGFRASALWGDRNQACRRDDVCSAEGLRLGERASTSATVATWSLAGGVAALGTGVLIWLWPRNEPSDEVTHHLASGEVAVTPLPDGWRLQIGGVF